MLTRIISVFWLSLVLVACAQNNSKTIESKSTAEPLSEKCQDAKQDLEKAVEAGEQDNRELKRNIELYCVWRRY